MNFGKSQGLSFNIFHSGDHINKPKWTFFISGMNIPYIFFFKFDLPIDYHKFHEIAVNIM